MEMTLDSCTGLVVDDEKDSLDSLSELLELNDICIIGKGLDGEEAYQLYKKLRPKFLILDMNMPKYDGNYAIKKIKDDDPNAKIIVLTGHVDYKFDKNEVIAVLTKPCKINSLMKILKDIC